MADGDFKRQIAYKIKIGDVFKGRPIFDGERFNFLEIGERKVVRVNIVANVVERYLSDEKHFLSLTIDDASGQVKIKVFREDIPRFENISPGDTVMAIGLLRSYNNEIYITPEILKQKDPRYLLVRKLEFEKEAPEPIDNNKVLAVADQIIQKIKLAEPEGVSTENLILELKENADLINQEVRKALEQGIIYEPRPGILRYLGSD